MPHFNPRSPCGERQLRTAFQIQKFYISIHAPRAGSDGNLRLHCPLHCQISIHAPRAGSDPSLLLVQGGLTHISIHAPRAGSDAPTAPICSMRAAFQSTLPVRGATSTAIVGMRWQTIFQSTLPVRGATSSPVTLSALSIFQSTLPVRGATAKMPKTEPFILSNFHNFKKYTDRTRTKVIIKMELWINLSPFSGANRTGNLWSLLLRTLKGS